MAALLAADGIAVLPHILQHIPVAHSGLLGLDALRLHKLDEAQIGHDGDNGGVAVQTAFLLHGQRQQRDDLVAVDLLPLFVAGKAAVGVAVKGDAAVEAACNNGLFEVVEVGAADALVDVLPVRLHAEEGTLGTQPGEELLRDFGRCAVGAVDADVQAGQVAVDGLVQVIHIVLQAVGAEGHFAHRAAGGQRDVGAVVVDVLLDLILHLVGQLVAGAGEDLDAVEFHRVVGGRDHHTRVGVVFLDQIGHCRGRQHAEALDVRPHAAQTGGQRSFQHIAGLPGVLADQDAGAMAGPPGQHSGRTAADLHGHFTGQIHARHTADTIGTKILSHFKNLTFR